MSKHLVAVYGTLREGQGNWAWALNHPGAEKKGVCHISLLQDVQYRRIPCLCRW